jgi:hypothetical protein
MSAEIEQSGDDTTEQPILCAGGSAGNSIVLDSDELRRGPNSNRYYWSEANREQGRFFIFTINNPCWKTPADFIATLVKFFPSIEGVLFQIERGNTAGTLHIQGMMKLKDKMKATAAKNKFKSKEIGGWIAYIVDLEKCWLYCKKEDTRVQGPFYWGVWDENTDLSKHKAIAGKEGKQSALTMAIETIKEGCTLDDLAKKHPSAFVRNCGGLAKLHKVFNTTKRNWKTQVFIMLGIPGAGKTYHVHKLAPDAYWIPRTNIRDGKVWFDGYDGQADVILDDFYGEIDLPMMLNIMDAYPLKVPYKGGFTEFLAKKLYITSNSPSWEAWYQTAFMKNKLHREAFERRITEVQFMTSKYKDVTDEQLGLPQSAIVTAPPSPRDTTEDLMFPGNQEALGDFERNWNEAMRKRVEDISFDN